MPSFTAPEQEVEFEVYCETCGAGLCNQSTTVKTRNRNMDAVRVEACTDCMKQAKAEGHDEGYDEGYEAARKEFEQ